MSTPSSKIKFAVVGCGHIGRRHLEVIAAQPNAELVAFCDKDPKKLPEFQERFPDAKAFEDFEEMITSAPVDIVSICTPHGLHPVQSVRASLAGKHVLVEKPMALTTLESRRMIEAAERAGKRLFVVKQNRYNQPSSLVQKALTEGWLGRPFMVQCNVIWNRRDAYYTDSPWRGSRLLEGGALHTQVSHFLDLLIWWFGDLVQAKTIMDTLNHEIEIEDAGASALRFDSGVVGSLLWTTCAYRQNFEGSITIIAEKGTIRIGGKYLNVIEHWEVEDHPLPNDLVMDDRPNHYGTYQGSSNNHDKFIDAVIGSLLKERKGVVEGNEGIRSIQAIEMIYGGA